MKKRKCLLIILLVILGGCSKSDIIKNKTKESLFESDNCYKYYYQQLNKKQQKLYEELYNIFMNIDKEGTISNKNIKDINIVHNAVLNDHPEIFYVDTEIVYNDYRVEVEYHFKKKDILDYRKQLEKRKKEILKDLPKDKYDQMLYIYDYVIENVDYNKDAKYNQTLISSLINKETVCTGYAKMIQFLLQEIGINTTEIIGSCIDENNYVQKHAWNMVYYNDDYYYIDATWGDQTELLMTFYEYFLFSSDDMLKIYTPEKYYETTTNLDNTYFKKNNLYFISYDKSQLVNAVDKDNRILRVRFSSDIYEYAKDKIMNTNDPFDILNKRGIYVENIRYWYDDHFHVITIKW